MSTMFDVLKSYHPEGDKKTVEDMTKLALSSERRLALLEMREAVYQELQDYLSADKPDAKKLRILEQKLSDLRRAAERTDQAEKPQSI